MTKPCRPVLGKLIVMALLSLITRKTIPASLEQGVDGKTARINLWAVQVNGTSIADFAHALRTIDAKLFLAREQLVAARLLVPTVAPIQVDGEEFFPLDAIAGVQSSFDTTSQTLVIVAPPTAFSIQNLDGGNKLAAREATSGTGAFLNYDITHVRSQTGSATSALTEGVLFSPLGTLSSRYVINQLGAATTKHIYRLDSQFVREYPQQVAQLVIGDSLSGASGSGRQIYFGGVQWKTNFALRPDYQALPLPFLSGVAAAPSVIDIYVDNVLRRQQPVDTGPFSLSNLPLVSGNGNIQLVVNDILGRQQVISQSYLVTPQILKTGAHDFSVESGRERLGLGSPTSKYGASFASGTYRAGYPSGTVEWHGEAGSHREVFGMGFATALLQSHLLAVGATASRSPQGTGELGFVQLSRTSGTFGYSGKIQVASTSFRQLGLDDVSTEPTRQVQLQMSKSLGASTNVTLSYLSRVTPQQSTVRVLSATLNMALPKRSFFSFALTKLAAVGSGWSINASLFIPLGTAQFSQVGVSRQNGVHRLTVDYQQSAPVEKGWGYRARQTFFDHAGTDIGANYNGDTSQMTLSASQQGSQRGIQAEVRGGLAAMGGHVLATRWIEDSFAVVEVPLEEPVDIYANNRLAAKTHNGVGVIPRLVPHVPNRVFLDAQSLPINVSLDLADKEIVPRTRSGLLLKFDAHTVNSATIELVDAQSRPLPPATLVSINGSDEGYPIGLRGLLYIYNTDFPLSLRVHNSDIDCAVKIEQPRNVEPMAKMGPYICEAVRQ